MCRKRNTEGALPLGWWEINSKLSIQIEVTTNSLRTSPKLHDKREEPGKKKTEAESYRDIKSAIIHQPDRSLVRAPTVQ